MLVNCDKEVIGYPGKVLMNGETPVTVGFLLKQSLDLVHAQDSVNTKYIKGCLIHRLNGTCEINDLEKEMLKEAVVSAYGPYLITMLFDILDGKGA